MNSSDKSPEGLVGQTIGGRYKVVRVLGEGGMGVVYVGEQVLGGTVRKVAIKTLHPHLSHDPKILARFERECGTIAELQHPNTIQVYDFGKTDDGILYIVMEFVQGQSVAEVLEKEGPMPPPRVEKILTQVVGSLEEAHQHDIVHRDLKPENVVLCDRAGQKDWVEVLDFGIAKRQKEEDKEERKLTQAGMVLGTPPYMSPEQFTGRPIDARSDIYSLGIMAYEMLTGRLPFHGNTAYEWATQHMVQPPAPIETQPMGTRVPQSMRQAISRALAKDPAQRFPNVREFLEAFTGKGGEAAAAGQAGLAYAQTAALGAAQPPFNPAGGPGASGGYSTAPGVSAGYVTGPTPGYNTGDLGAVSPRGRTEIGAQVEAPGGYGPPPQQQGFQGAAPAMPNYGAPPNAGYGAPPGAQAGPARTEAKGGRTGLVVGVLVVALLVCGAAVAAGLGVFSGGGSAKPADSNIFGPGAGGTPSASTTTPPATTTEPTASTNTPPSTSSSPSLPPLNPTPTTPTRGTGNPSTKPHKDAGAATTPNIPPITIPSTLPTPPVTTPPVTTPPQPPPPPPPVIRPGEPPECAAARTWCAKAASDSRAAPLCTSQTAACKSKGGNP